jgi:hypothetical protein
MPRKKKEVLDREAQMLEVLVVDIGNALVKWKLGTLEGSFPHAVTALTDNQWESAVARYGKENTIDFVQTETGKYVTGSTAENYFSVPRSGRSKYERDYYGVLFASVIARIFADAPHALDSGVDTFASYAPLDVEFRDYLKESISGRWDFESAGVRFKFRVNRVDTYEEPFGGYANTVFTPDGLNFSSKEFRDKSILVIDVGGGTCNILPVLENGTVNYLGADSRSMGINQVLDRLQAELEHDYRDYFRKGAPPRDRLRRALREGVYNGWGKSLPCHEQAVRAASPLIGEIINMYLGKGRGGAGVDIITLTGGGAAGVEKLLVPQLEHDRVLLSDHPEFMHLSNVRGADKFRRMLEAYRIV